MSAVDIFFVLPIYSVCNCTLKTELRKRKRREWNIIFRDIYLVTYHRVFDNRTEQILVDSLEKARKPERACSVFDKTLRMVGIKGFCSTVKIGKDGIHVIGKNDKLENISGESFSIDKTYYIITCYKKYSRKSASGAVDSYDDIQAGINEIAGDGYTGKVIVNEVSSRGVYMIDADEFREVVPFDTGDRLNYDPEFAIVPY